jgi:hypothetical protein
MPLVEGQRVQYTMRRGRNTIVKWFNLPWLARGSNISSIYHRQAVRYTMGRESKFQTGGSIYHG